MTYTKALRECKKTSIFKSHSSELFEDYHNIIGICSHPLVLGMKAAKKLKEMESTSDESTDSGSDDQHDDLPNTSESESESEHTTVNDCKCLESKMNLNDLK